MLEIILARHGETEWNAAEIFRGRADVPLNETGLKQAKLLGEYLSREKISTIYASPLQRAVKTAEAIAAHHKLEVNITDSLNDIDCGEWQGRTVSDVKEKYAELYQDWLDTPEQVRLPGGESLEDVSRRVVPLVQNVVRRSREGKVVLVSHRVVNKVLICALLCLDNSSFWNFRLDTGGITRFIYEGGRAVLTCHNDTSYLNSIPYSLRNDF